MPRRRATPASSTPSLMAPTIHNQTTPSPLKTRSSHPPQTPVEMGCFQPILLHLCYSLCHARRFSFRTPPFSFSSKSRPLPRLGPPRPRHICPSTHANPSLGYRGRFDALYVHRDSSCNASLTRYGYAGSKTFVRLVHSHACCTP